MNYNYYFDTYNYTYNYSNYGEIAAYELQLLLYVQLPLLRWKKNPFLAAFVITSLLLIIPITSFVHTQVNLNTLHEQSVSFTKFSHIFYILPNKKMQS